MVKITNSNMDGAPHYLKAIFFLHEGTYGAGVSWAWLWSTNHLLMHREKKNCDVLSFKIKVANCFYVDGISAL